MQNKSKQPYSSESVKSLLLIFFFAIIMTVQQQEMHTCIPEGIFRPTCKWANSCPVTFLSQFSKESKHTHTVFLGQNKNMSETSKIQIWSLKGVNERKTNEKLKWQCIFVDMYSLWENQIFSQQSLQRFLKRVIREEGEEETDYMGLYICHLNEGEIQMNCNIE